MSRKNFQRNIFISFSIIPPLLITVVFLAIPAVRAFCLSFTDANMIGIGGTSFTGLENYRYMFSDQVFMKAFRNTVILLIVVPLITITVSLILSEILHRGNLREAGFYRVVFFFPSIISLTVVAIVWSFIFHPTVAIVWSFIFHPTMGLVNSMLDFLHLSQMKRSWLGTAETALGSIAFTLVWQAAGYYLVMILAAMTSINNDYYEAATIDGAGWFRQFVWITLPEVKNIIIITIILSMSGTLPEVKNIIIITIILSMSGTLNLSFTLSTIMTNGGPNNASLVLLKYIYNQGMTNGNFGYSMAITVFTLLFSIILSIAVQKLQRREEAV